MGPGIYDWGGLMPPSFIVRRMKNHGHICLQCGNTPFVGRMMTHSIESNLLDAYLDKLKHVYAHKTIN